MSETNNKGVKVLASASLLFVTIIWGSAFVVMKNSMDAITPTYLLAYRFRMNLREEMQQIISVIIFRRMG